jgi:hypothetical protein
VTLAETPSPSHTIAKMDACKVHNARLSHAEGPERMMMYTIPYDFQLCRMLKGFMYTAESRERQSEALKTLEVRLVRRMVRTAAWDLYASMEKSPDITAATRPAYSVQVSFSCGDVRAVLLLTMIPVALYDCLIESSKAFQAWAHRISFSREFPAPSLTFEISSATQRRARISDGWPR